MASPYLAGVAAAALQYVNTLMPGASDTDKQLLVNRLLMSTADILYDENGVAYSPRKQGSGMVNLAEASPPPPTCMSGARTRPRSSWATTPTSWACTS